MTLRERCVDILGVYGFSITASTLRCYYKRAGVVFRKVDLHTTTKLSRATEILTKQQEFVRRIREVQADPRRLALYIDETSCSLWSPLLRRTWTNGEIHLPMQAHRGANRTIIGATGGNAHRIFSMFSVVRRTNKESVLAFLKKLFRRVRHPLRQVTLVLDN